MGINGANDVFAQRLSGTTIYLTTIGMGVNTSVPQALLELNGTFLINQSGTARVYADTQGEFGINTTSPTSTLHVAGTVNVTGIVNYYSNITYSIGNGNNQVCFERIRGTQSNYTKCFNGTHVIEQIGVFVIT